MPIKNTTYTGPLGQQIPADITLIHATPNDTVVELTPMIYGGTTQKIYWSGKDNPNLYQYSEFYTPDRLEVWQLSDFQDYWIPRGKEALRNANWDLRDKIGAWFRGITLPNTKISSKRSGGQLDNSRVRMALRFLKNRGRDVSKISEKDYLKLDNLFHYRSGDEVLKWYDKNFE